MTYTKLARSLVRHPLNPVIKVWEKGEWNHQTLGCFTVLDDGDKFFFNSGGARHDKPTNVGMATSPRNQGVIMPSSERFLRA